MSHGWTWLAVAWMVAGWDGTGRGIAGPVVSNVRTEPGARPAELRIVYDLEGDGGNDLEITVAESMDGGRTFRPVGDRVAGDVGGGVTPGKSRTIAWSGLVGGWVGASNRLTFQLSAQDVEPIPGMVRIQPGTFQMGSLESEVSRDSDEDPVTLVTLTHGYWLGKCEVTQSEWMRIIRLNPSHFKGDPELPVEQVSWEDAMDYCRRLTRQEREAGRLPRSYEYRLPTAAEWEYACRAGTATATAFGERLDANQGNFQPDHPDNVAVPRPIQGGTLRVGSYPPNAWGLYDMHGNVWEWCLDWYAPNLPGGGVRNPIGPPSGANRIYRGGSWFEVGWYCRSAYRNRTSPSTRFPNLGFRVACAPVLR